MAWLYVVIGGLLDVVWAFGLRESEGFTRWLPSIWTIATLAASFYFFGKAMRMLEVGVAYAVFTGIGTAGTALVGMLLLGEPADALRVFFIFLLIAGILGLKLTSKEGAEQGISDRGQEGNS